MIEHIPEMIDAGIDSFKIEGRIEDGSVCGNGCKELTARRIDDYLEDPKKYEANMLGTGIRFRIVHTVSLRHGFYLETG